MELEAYSEQLSGALQQMRARVIEVRAGQYDEHERLRIDLELMQELIGALTIGREWERARAPVLPPPGVGLEALRGYVLRASVAAGLDEELDGALQAIYQSQAIYPDFSVEAIDNAIGVVERQAAHGTPH
jgi:hypothetical protein